MEPWTWVAVLMLGLWHGVNPGMGWLFAVALGMQEGRERAVWRALLPLAAGHLVAVGAAIAVAVLAGRAVEPGPLRWLVAAVLVGFGAWRLARRHHPRWTKMRVNDRELATWSLLMASAHGAGLMLMPFVVGDASAGTAAHASHALLLASTPFPSAHELSGVGAAALHTAGYLLAAGGVAVLVYRRLGLRRLREAWVNLDLLWGVALIATGVLAPLL
jgi:hypothetical protein